MSTTVTLRPTADLRSSGQTVHGAGSIHAATSDDSDSSYTASAVGGYAKVGFPGHTFAVGAVIESVTVRLRMQAADDSQVTTLLNGASTGPFPFTPGVTIRTDTGFPVPGVSTQAVANGLALQWNNRGPFQVAFLEAYLDVIAIDRPTVTVTEPSAPLTTSRPRIEWDGAGDYPQSQFQVKIFTETQYEAPGFNPTGSEALFDSGIQLGGDDSFKPTVNLSAGITYRFYVRVAQTPPATDEPQWSAWDFAEEPLTVTPPAVPTIVVAPDDDNARIQLTITDGGGGAYGAGEAAGVPAARVAPPTSFPYYVATGAQPLANGDIDRMMNVYGAQGMRSSFITWEAGDPNLDGSFVPKAAWTNLIQHCNDKGFGLVLEIGLGPSFGGKGFARNAPNPNGGTVNVPKVLSQFAVAVGSYYDGTGGKPLVTEIELFNEVQGGKFDNGKLSGVKTFQQKGAAYLEYLARIYPPLKAARPDLQIYSSGLLRNNPQPFVEGLIAATFTLGGHDYSLASDKLFDKFGCHTYFYYGAADPARSGIKNMDECYAMLVAVPGLEAIEFVSTEQGYPITLDANGNPDGVHTLAESANGMLDGVAAWQERPWAGGGGNVLSWFNHKSGGAQPDKSRQDFGILAHDNSPNSPRPETFQAIIDAQYPHPPPVTTYYTPAKGAAAGGTTLTIYGSFLQGASVTVGGVPCTSVVVAADHKSLTCDTGAHAAGLANVVVTTTHGAYTHPDKFQYKGATSTNPPTVGSVTPATGSTAGGTKVVIVGTNFDTVDESDPTAVTFGGTNAASFSVKSATKIVAFSPAGGAGRVDVVVTNPDGSSDTGPGSKFTYGGTHTPQWDFVSVERSSDGGLTWQPVRSGTRASAGGGPFELFDYEACNGVDVEYRAQAIKVVGDGDVASDWSDPTDDDQWSSLDVWLKSPTVPALNAKVLVNRLPTLTYPLPQGSFDVEGRADPVIVADTRKLPAFTVTFVTLDPESRDAVTALLDRSEVLLLQAPPAVDFGCRYIAVGEVAENRVVPENGLDETRLIDCPCREVLAPVGDIITIGMTWSLLLEEYATWDAVAVNASWQDVLDLTPPS